MSRPNAPGTSRSEKELPDDAGRLPGRSGNFPNPKRWFLFRPGSSQSKKMESLAGGNFPAALGSFPDAPGTSQSKKTESFRAGNFPAALGNFPDAAGTSQFKKMESFSSGNFPIQKDGSFFIRETPNPKRWNLFASGTSRKRWETSRTRRELPGAGGHCRRRGPARRMPRTRR